MLSVGGYMNKKGNNKKIDIPYNNSSFGDLTIPVLLWDANEFDGMTASKLSQYTLMRLYSADKSWCDDVGFSILRLAAFG